MIKKTLFVFYVVMFLNFLVFGFCATTYVPFLESINLNKFQMGTINAVFMFSVFLLELPTGIYADTLGRRKSFLISIIFLSLGMSTYYIAHNLWVCLIAEILVAFNCAFASGASEAWIVDTLKHHGYSKSFDEIFSKEKRYASLGCIMGGFVGAYIGRFNLRLPWLVSAITGIIMFFVARILMKEEYFIPQKLNTLKDKIKHTFKLAKDGIQYGFKNKNVFYLISLHSGIIFGVQAFNMYWTLRFRQNFSQEILGWAWAGFLFFTWFGAESIKIINKHLKKQKCILLFYVLLIFTSAFLCFALYQNIYLLIFFFLINEFGRGGFEPLKKSYINKHVPSNKRATVLSFSSMIVKLGAFVGLLISGFMANSFSIQISWLFSSIIILLSSLFCFKLNGKTT